MSKQIEYKKTRLSWCPEIPNDWEIKRLKYVVSIFGRIGFRGYTVADIVNEGEGAISLSPSNITNEQKFSLEKKTHISFEKYYESPEIIIEENDVIFVKTASVGKTTIVFPKSELMTINPQLVVFKNYRIERKYFYYYLISNSFQEQVNTDLNGGVVNNISQEKINQYSIICPPIEQQKLITTFLDQKTTEIDNLISKKQRLIGCLKEERMAIINQAVTKGTTNDIEMKDSGIDWLGQIPKHWEVKKLKYVLAEVKGALKPGPFGSDLKNSDLTPNGEYKVYTQRNVIDNDFEVGEDYISEDKFQLLNVFEVNENDILISTRGTIGKSVIVPKEFQKGIIHPCLIRVTLNQELIFNKFLQLFFNESSYFLENVKLYSNSTIIEVIYGNTLREVFVPVPPKDEQIQITTIVEHKMKEIDNTIEKIEQEIVLINEYRTSLVNEVVTGKITLN